MISVIIPNYNGEKLLKKNLPRVVEELSRYNKHTVEIIIVDDCSEDNSCKWLKAYKDKINNNLSFRLLKNEKNLGFSSTVNKGVKEAVGEIVILLNSDVYPKERFLDYALPHFKDKKVFAVGFLDKSIENGKIVRRGRGIGWWERGFLLHKRGEVDKTDTFWVSGGSGAFRKQIWDKLNGFNEIYNPFYWEDIDLSYRARKSGYKILFEPKSVVIHEHSKGSILSKYSKGEITTISYRNQFLFVWSNASFSEVCKHVIWLPFHLAQALVRKDVLFFKGLSDALARLFLNR